MWIAGAHEQWGLWSLDKKASGVVQIYSAQYRMCFLKPVKRALLFPEVYIFLSLIRRCLVGWGSAEAYE